MSDMTTALAWLAGKRKERISRAVTYRRLSTEQVKDIRASIGQTQAVNVNSLMMEPGVQDMAILAADMANRDYIVAAVDLEDFWPPQSGDLIDDPNDREGLINRFQAMSLPGQNPWRWFRGGYQTHARIHTKFLSEYASIWIDEFTGTDGTALESHTPDSPDDGTYSGGSGTVVIAGNRIVAGTADAFRYFAAGESNLTARVNWNANLTADQISGKYAEMGLGVRCAGSGVGLRDGYYCTLRINPTGGLLKIIKRLSGTSTIIAQVGTPTALALTETYRLEAKCDDDLITFSLLDLSGEVVLASTYFGEAVFLNQTACAVFFGHHASLDVGLPWMDQLTVEA